MVRWLPTLSLALLPLLAACNGAATPAAGDATPSGEPAAAAADPVEARYERLKDPSAEHVNEQAPDVFRARFETSAGDVTIEVTRAWAPRGADRFYNLVKNGWFDGVRFFRVLDGFMAQFGMSGDPRLGQAWAMATFPDDPVAQSNTRGMVTFAKATAPNSRSTQVFINTVDNANLDGAGFAPFGKVVEGMEVVDELHSGYGEGPPRGTGPDQNRIRSEGNAYLQQSFPELDHVERATIVE